MELNNHGLLDRLYEQPSLTPEDSPSNENGQWGFLLFSFLVVGLIGFYIGYNKSTKPKCPKEPEIDPKNNNISDNNTQDINIPEQETNISDNVTN